MIDLHTHILPGIDDGAPDLETALAMATRAVEQGVTHLAATPHFYTGDEWPRVKREADQFRLALKDQGIALTVVTAAELFLELELCETEREDIPTYGGQGKYALVEFPLREIPDYSRQVIFSLQTKGITPIIAHPERNLVFMNDPNQVAEWIEVGCLTQMNSGSLLGRFGTRVKRAAEILLNHGMVHFVASDAHSLGSRGVNLSDSFHLIETLAGRSVAELLTKDNPSKVIEGAKVPVCQPQVYRQRKRFWFF